VQTLLLEMLKNAHLRPRKLPDRSAVIPVAPIAKLVTPSLRVTLSLDSGILAQKKASKATA
jgi:hypothetical protein